MVLYNNEPMAKHTTFKVGGPVKNYIVIGSEQELADAVRDHPDYYIIGNGSNLIVSDDGWNGTVIELGKSFSDISIDAEGKTIMAQAGASLAALAVAARDNELTGLEFASGIPGTLGGACVMNAGAYDGEMKNVLTSIRLMDPEGNIIEQTPEECELGYRYSNIPERKLIVIGAKMKLSEGNADDITARMKELNQRRLDKQPLEYPSAGSTFKRPTGYFAGKLIQDAGLQGYRVGGMEVSKKHAGFVINVDGGTCEDFLKLTEDVIARVRDESGVTLEREVKILR